MKDRPGIPRTIFCAVVWLFLLPSVSRAQFVTTEQRIDFAPANIESNAPVLAVTEDGYAYTAWQDERSATGVYVNFSADAGVTWQNPDTEVSLAGSATIGTGPHCRG